MTLHNCLAPIFSKQLPSLPSESRSADRGGLPAGCVAHFCGVLNWISVGHVLVLPLLECRRFHLQGLSEQVDIAFRGHSSLAWSGPLLSALCAALGVRGVCGSAARRGERGHDWLLPGLSRF